MRRHQSGVMLLEALIAILIFSVGILGLVGMQASTLKASRDAKYRADAGLLANELIGQMWIGARDHAALQTNFQGGGGADGTAYTAWAARVANVLPGAGAAENPPVVAFAAWAAPDPLMPPASTVTVTVRWQAPNEKPSPVNPLGTVHNYSVVVQII